MATDTHLFLNCFLIVTYLFYMNLLKLVFPSLQFMRGVSVADATTVGALWIRTVMYWIS